MSRRAFIVESASMAVGVACALLGCSGNSEASPHTRAVADSAKSATLPAKSTADPAPSEAHAASPRNVDDYTFTQGSQVDRGIVVNDSLETPAGRQLHFSLCVPDAYDGDTPFALYVACPGWEGLYFQGVGANLQEDYPFEARSYVSDLVVASPQLDDWGQQSAHDVIGLTEWLMAAFNIDPERVFLSGCSGGGETISYVLGMRPEPYRRALHTISRWDGDVDQLAAAETPVYLAIGENDDYYGSEPAREGYARIRSAYEARGVSAERVDELVVLDVKPTSYFEEHGMAGAGQHGAGGHLFAHDPEIMGWLFG